MKIDALYTFQVDYWTRLYRAAHKWRKPTWNAKFLFFVHVRRVTFFCRTQVAICINRLENISQQEHFVNIPAVKKIILLVLSQQIHSCGCDFRNRVSTLPFQGLDASQQCALLKIVQALRGSVSDQQYSCRSSGDEETVAIFTIPCN